MTTRRALVLHAGALPAAAPFAAPARGYAANGHADNSVAAELARDPGTQIGRY
jgi:hypothetical protein